MITQLTTAPNYTPEKSQLIKGMWVSHIANAYLTYTGTMDNALHQLSKLNYNTVYIDVYNNGTCYSSKYAPRNYLMSLPFTNPLKAAIKESKRQGLKVYAWYEHGLMTFPYNKLAIEHPDWILSTSDNKKLIDYHYWLDPANPEVQQYFINLFSEVAASYPELYGIQIDDHWGIPQQFGNKTAQMTQLTNKVVEAIKKIRPDLIISLSPNPYSFSLKKYSQDWLTWVKAGLIDEIIMQIYRQTSQEVTLAINNSELGQVNNYVDVAVGIYAGNFRNQKPLAEIQSQIIAVKRLGYGYAIFPWKTSVGILRSHRRATKERYLKAI